MSTIQLKRKWQLGRTIGSGGFGRVFEAVADDGEVGVIKLVPKAPGADRELLFEDLVGVPNIVPMLEVGETGDAFAIAMPRAEKSLSDAMQAGLPFPLSDVLGVLEDLAETLAALDAKVVHRDIKPDNILLLDGRWCLADFGIARYAEASTAPDTQKYALSAPYAAPERWRMERATSATDVYSLGIVAFELLSGKRPFPGPQQSDYRNQHLTQEAPQLVSAPPSLAGLVGECLFKEPGARPTAANVLQRLKRAGQPRSEAAEKLAKANAMAAQATATAQASVETARLRDERRRALFEAASVSFQSLREELRAGVAENAPQAGRGFPFKLGGAELRFEGPDAASMEAFARTGYEPGFEVVAYGDVFLTTGKREYEGRAHSLWYCDAHQEGVFRWYETAWMMQPLMQRRYRLDPTALPPGEDTFLALTPVTGTHELAWPFTAVDQGDGAEFLERWQGWFADAAVGNLHQPRSMPERDPRGSFRSPAPSR